MTLITRLRQVASLALLCTGMVAFTGASATDLSEGKLIWCPKGAKESACKAVAATQSPLTVSIATSAPIVVRPVADRPLPVALAASDPIPIRDAEPKAFSGPEWWLVYVTAALAIATGGLFVWTMKLAKGASRDAEDSKAVAIKALAAAESSANASASAVVVMQRQLVAATGQLDAANKSAEASEAAVKVMKSQLAATRAPRLALRLATVYPRSNQPGPSIASIKLFVHNTGLSSAVVVGAGFYLEWQKNETGP